MGNASSLANTHRSFTPKISPSEMSDFKCQTTLPYLIFWVEFSEGVVESSFASATTPTFFDK